MSGPNPQAAAEQALAAQQQAAQQGMWTAELAARRAAAGTLPPGTLNPAAYSPAWARITERIERAARVHNQQAVSVTPDGRFTAEAYLATLDLEQNPAGRHALYNSPLSAPTAAALADYSARVAHHAALAASIASIHERLLALHARVAYPALPEAAVAGRRSKSAPAASLAWAEFEQTVAAVDAEALAACRGMTELEALAREELARPAWRVRASAEAARIRHEREQAYTAAEQRAAALREEADALLQEAGADYNQSCVHAAWCEDPANASAGIGPDPSRINAYWHARGGTEPAREVATAEEQLVAATLVADGDGESAAAKAARSRALLSAASTSRP